MDDNKILVTNTAIIVNDYKLGDAPSLEDPFKVWDPITHKLNMFGIYYDTDNKRLYLPAGMDLWRVRKALNKQYYKRIQNTPFKTIDINMKYPPRDREQIESLKFTCGLDEYGDNLYCPSLSINLATGKGKTYCSIATIAYYKIKSIIITGSNSLLSQWKDEIVKYTSLDENQILQISGTPMINMIFSGKSNKANNAAVYLVSHGTIYSYANQYGWDKINQLFTYLGIGLKFYDEAHTFYENILMTDYFTNVYKTFYVTATPGRSARSENFIYKISMKNIPSIDLFDEEKDPHTAYVALKYNSHPTPQQVSACKGKYGLDRMKYIDYITKNPNFYAMLRIVMELVLKCNGRVLMYIGTNEGILRVYHWIATNYQEFMGDIGIFTSLVSSEEKLEEKKKRLLLSTTKSAGLGEHIEGLKMTIILAEPFKSDILAKQSLGRTRDNNTTYIELVDIGFMYTKKYYLDKLPTFNKYATSVSDTLIDSYELKRRSENIINERNSLGENPFIFYDKRFDFSDAAKSNGTLEDTNPEQRIERDKYSISDNSFLKPKLSYSDLKHRQ